MEIDKKKSFEQGHLRDIISTITIKNRFIVIFDGVFCLVSWFSEG